MLDKKSYMNKENILSEGIFDKIMQLIVKGKVKRIAKAFQNDPEIIKTLKDLKSSQKAFDDKVKKWEKQNKDKVKAAMNIIGKR